MTTVQLGMSPTTLRSRSRQTRRRTPPPCPIAAKVALISRRVGGWFPDADLKPLAHPSNSPAAATSGTRIKNRIIRSMQFRVALLLALVLLAGCSGREDARVKRVIGNGAYVSVWDISDEMDATPLAERHCRQYGKSARLREMIGDRAIYECVSP